MLVALTGVSGFIGAYTAKALQGRGHQVRGLVRSSSKRQHIEGVVAEFVVGEFDDPAAQRQLVAGAGAVIHNAVAWDARDAVRNFEVNVLGSLRLLEAARAAGAQQFVFVSSVAALSEISDEWGGEITETHPTWPGSLYGAAKAAVESHLKAYHHAHGLNTSAWRPAAVYGVDPNLDRSQWLGLIRDVKQNKPIDTPQGGKITHVQDVADALALAVGDASTAGQFYNLVDRYLYWQDVAEIARDVADSSSRVNDRRGSGPKNEFDCAKAIAFFDRHGNGQALRRGTEGVRAYVRELAGLL
ncbi:MAG TPA: NAD(P)-dependent oxidoreductase [Tepidisphaeraceae bacterium]|jgi:nucleoside-diphosphate-sugar epimerase